MIPEDCGCHFDLTGPGPFELPYAARFVSIHTGWKDYFVIEFQSRDGKTILLPVAYQALPMLAETLRTLPAVFDGTLPTEDI